MDAAGNDYKLRLTLTGVGGDADGIDPLVTPPFDCHGAPVSLRLESGWPPMLSAVDDDGVIATSVADAPLVTVLELEELKEGTSEPVQIYAGDDVLITP